MSFFLSGFLFARHRRWEGGKGGVLVADLGGGVPVGAIDGMGDTAGVEGDCGGARHRQWVLTEVVQDFVKEVGEGRSSLHQVVT